MKAFFFTLTFFLLFSISTTPSWAKITDYQTSNSQTFSVPADSTVESSQPEPVATNSGTIRLLPMGDGSYQVATTDPNSTAPYQITQAQLGGACDIPGVGLIPAVGAACTVAGALGSIGDLGNDLWNGRPCAVDPGCWIKKSVSLVQSAMVKMLAGCEPQDDECWEAQYQSVMNPDAPVQNAGAVMVLANLTGNVASMQIPISTDLYLANINPFREVSAQGFNDLRQADVIFDIWKKARDAAYALSIVILVIVGFMIMLRTKLDSKTSINLSNALPKIVIMLLLITFSFAISGLIIDIGRIAVQFGLYLIPDVFSTATLGRLFLNSMYLVTVPLFLFVTGISSFACGDACAGAATTGFLLGGGVFVFVAAALAAVTLFLIMLILVLILTLYLLFIMITRYAKFIVSTMISPLIMLAYPLPHGSSYIVDFYKRQIGYILTIPIVIFLVEVSFAIAGACIPSPFSAGLSGRLDSAIGDTLSPCATGLAVPGTDFNPFGLFSAIAPLVGLGVLFMSTKAGDIADGLLHIKPITHGGGGHGGGLFGILAVKELAENVGDASKFRQSTKNMFGSAASRFAVGRSLPRNYIPTQTNNRGITPQNAPVLSRFEAGKPIPRKADLNTAQRAEMGRMFTQAGLSPDTVERFDYPELVNRVRESVGFTPLRADGMPTSVGMSGRMRNIGGRMLGADSKRIVEEINNREKNIINRELATRYDLAGTPEADRAAYRSPASRVGAEPSDHETGTEGNPYVGPDDDIH